MSSFWDSITGGISDAYDYVTDIDFSDPANTGFVEDIYGLFKNKDGSLNTKLLGNIGAMGGSALLNSMGFMSPDIKKVGYQGGIPSYTAMREQVPTMIPAAAAEAKEYMQRTGYKPMEQQLAGLREEFADKIDMPIAQPYQYDPNRRPGSSGRRYFTDVQYTAPDQVENARTKAQERALGLAALNAANPARQTRPAPPAPAPVQAMAQGGIASVQPKGYYLGGPTDGMADKVPATIDNRQPAALSDGEFVIPADVVSHLGNGNSNAGAQQLYGMMDKVRQERTGTKQQGKQINPNKFMPV